LRPRSKSPAPRPAAAPIRNVWRWRGVSLIIPVHAP
jgi:hypothetical protein